MPSTEAPAPDSLPIMAKDIALRGKKYGLRIRVPARYGSVESRDYFWKTLKTGDLTTAKLRAPACKADQIQKWEDALAGRAPQSAGRFERIVAVANARGFEYLTAEEIAASVTDVLLARVETLAAIRKPTPDVTAALLGTVDRPKLTVALSGLVAYVENLDDTLYENSFKGEEQTIRWRQARDRAVMNLRAAIKAKTGTDDKPVLELTSDDAWLHHGAWKVRLHKKEVEADTGNTDFGYVSALLTRFYASIKTPNPKIYAGVTLKDPHSVPKRRLELPVEWMEKTFFDPVKMAGLNEEARDITMIAAEVGARQSEIHDLPPDAFRLDHPIPHILIRNEEPEVQPDGTRVGGRQIKNIHSTRQVALVGYALEAARRHPRGFQRYLGKRTFSATVNKFLRENKLFPKPPSPEDKYTLGGTRHSFESRLKSARLHSDDRGEMMGHSITSERNRALYGDSMPLEVRVLIAKLISFGDAVSPEEREAARMELDRRGLFK